MASIGENIKLIRISRGLTQKQLGDLCVPKMADSAIRRYERGDANPKIETIYRIAKALGVTIGDLDTEYSQMSGDKKEVISVIEKLEQFSKDIQKMNISEERKQLQISKIKEVINSGQNLVKIIDSSISADMNLKHELDKIYDLKRDNDELQNEVNVMFYFLFNLLNDKGQEKAIEQMELLAKIPEYRKDTDE